jgi:hypothetical protein
MISVHASFAARLPFGFLLYFSHLSIELKISLNSRKATAHEKESIMLSWAQALKWFIPACG